jgi:hypothetical protein
MNGLFTVTGSGTDIWDAADAFQYVYQPLVGDGQIIARVLSVQNTDPWAKAGVMIRENLTPGSRNAALVVSAGNGLSFQRRVTTGGISTFNAAPGTAPSYVKLVRAGSVITAYSSLNGSTWTLAGTETITFPGTVLVGLAVTSHNNTLSNTSTLDNVEKSGPVVIPTPPPVPNSPPTVSLVSPTSGLLFVAPGTVALKASAADSDGTIARVDYFIEGNLTPIGSSTAGPTYTATWNGVPVGTYNVTARATDDLGATTISAPVIVTVTPIPPPPSGTSSASFVKVDSTTEGSWKNNYGVTGYQLAMDAVKMPSFASVSFVNKNDFNWVGTTRDIRALQKVNSNRDRFAKAWFNNTFNIAVNQTDNNTHQIALYVLDWDSSARAQTIQVLNAQTNNVLDTQTVSSFNGGKYLVWNIKGNVIFKVTSTAGTNAVVSGIFFDN